MITKLRLLPLAVTTAAFGVIPFPAIAQQTSSFAGLEEIVVTARRREESLQDVPISISAIDPGTMERLKLEQTEDLQFMVPSFMMQGSTKSSLQMSIRGQYVNDAIGTTDAPVNVYFGDALISRPIGTNQSMYDLEQVQVLKGVQGTLFGRNSTGGALTLTPAAPTDDFEGYIRGSLGNHDHREVQAMVNLPLTDTLALRVAGKTLDRDGFGKNLETGKDLEDKDMEAWRVSLRWNPTDTIESTTIYDHYQHDENASTAYSLFALDPSAPSIAGYNQLAQAAQNPFLQSIFPTLSGAFPATLDAILAEQRARSNPRDARSERGTGRPDEDFVGKGYSDAENWGIQNITTFEFDNFTLKNIAAYREMESARVDDMDGNIAGLIMSETTGSFDFFSEEFQIFGTALDDRLDWIAGLYYMKEEGSDFSQSNQFNALTVEGTRMGTFNALFDGTNLDSAVAAANAAASAASKFDITSGDVENSSKAAYLGLTYRFNDTWTLAGGLRYTQDKREYAATSRRVFPSNGEIACTFVVEENGVFVPLPLDQCNQRGSKTFHEVTYDATLTYNFSSDAMIYGAHRYGYRAGGFNGRARSFAAMVPYDPEAVDEYELGFKSVFNLGNTSVRANGAVFYQDYQDIHQQTSLDLGGNVIATTIENAAEGSIHGGELELEIRPSDFASLSLFYSYLDGDFDEYIDPGTGADLSDRWLVWAARHMGGATLNLYTPLDDMGELIWTLNVYAQSKQHLDDLDVEADQSGYELINASVTWENVAGSNFDLRLWGRNLTDKDYRVGGVSILDVAGFSSAIWGNPRTYGMDITYRFGR